MAAQNSYTPFKSFIEMLSALPDEQSCRTYLENIIWGGVPTCPHCGSKESYTLKTKNVFKGLYKCAGCKERYTVTINTMFEGSHIPLRKWFIAIYIFSLHKKGISSHQLASDLGITQKSAWFMLHRLRLAFAPSNFSSTLGNIVEVDESFIGGEAKNKQESKKTKNEQGNTMHEKQPVLGMLERNGKVAAVVVDNRNKETILPIIYNTVESDSVIMTDEYTAYKDLKNDYTHFKVNHGAKEYINGMAHTDGIENFWSHLKRGVDGIYHWVSKDHLQAYVNEFVFRYNARKESVNNKFDFSLNNSRKITYSQLIKKENHY